MNEKHLHNLLEIYGYLYKSYSLLEEFLHSDAFNSDLWKAINLLKDDVILENSIYNPYDDDEMLGKFDAICDNEEWDIEKKYLWLTDESKLNEEL